MKKDVTLKITGVQTGPDAEEEKMELITEGTMYKKGDALYLVYDEGEMTGFEGCKTSLKVEGDKVKVKRFGENVGIDTGIEFEKGRRYSGFYDTVMGMMEIEVLTTDIKNTLNFETPGSVSIDYDISLKGLIEGKNRLSITVM